MIRPLYLSDIGHFHLLCGTCRRCGELNVHGFYHQIKAAGQVEIYPERLRAWHRWACRKCGGRHAQCFRLTKSGRRRPRLIDWDRLAWGWFRWWFLPWEVQKTLAFWSLWAAAKFKV